MKLSRRYQLAELYLPMFVGYTGLVLMATAPLTAVLTELEYGAVQGATGFLMIKEYIKLKESQHKIGLSPAV